MKKIILKLHLWISLPFGLIIALICFTGSIMVFEKEINELVYKERYKVAPASGERITPAEAAAAAAAVLPDTMKIASVQIPFDKESTYAISTPGRRRITVYVNPYTAKVTAVQYPGEGKFFSTVRELHRWLSFRGESRTIGKRITGVTTFAMVIILITGLIAWIPKNRKGLKNRLKISFRHGPRRLWHDLHVAGGFYSMLLLLLMSLTGLTWSFDWYRNATYKLFGAEPPSAIALPVAVTPAASVSALARQPAAVQQPAPAHQPAAVSHPTDYTIWDTALIETLKIASAWKTITITDGSIQVVPDKPFGNTRASDRYKFDKKIGHITDAQLYRDQPKASKLRGWIYSLHTGSWGGSVVKGIYLLAALMGGVLPLTGYYMYAKRVFRKTSKPASSRRWSHPNPQPPESDIRPKAV